MKQTIILLLVIFIGASSFAQTVEFTENTAWDISVDSSYAVFAKKAFIRSGAGVSNPAVDSLLTGAKVTVKEITDKKETARNIVAPWIKVKYTKDGTEKEGYVWLGSIGIKNAVANNVNFIFGLDRVIKAVKKSNEDYVYDQYVLQIKAVGDTVIDQKEWKIDAGEMAAFMDMMLLGDTKLQNLQNVVRMQAGGEACGIPTNYFYYGWTGKKFLPLPGKYSVGDAGVFYHSETLLFPHEKGGQPNKILKLTEEEEVLEEATETKKEKVKRSKSKEVYVWNGEKAIKQK